jgi:DNA-directed RNA polymerase specialized sigma24 family protein
MVRASLVSGGVQLPPFQLLLDAHGQELHRFLIGLVGPQDAEDCLQETLLAALRAYPQLRHGQNLRAWLYTIAQRKATDSFRRRRRVVPLDGAGPAVEPHEPLDDGLWRQVATLPPKQRSAVVQRFALDLGYRDIAERIGCSEAAARRSVHEGIKKLRTRLDR